MIPINLLVQRIDSPSRTLHMTIYYFPDTSAMNYP